MTGLSDFLLILVGVVVVTSIINMLGARRSEKRILSASDGQVQEIQARSDIRIQETRKNNEAYQNRIVALMEEHNSLLREVLAELKSRSPRS